jgi:hypothetical protein
VSCQLISGAEDHHGADGGAEDKVGPIGSTVPATVSWDGKDATSGVAHYTLYESHDGGGFSSLGTVTGKTKSLNLGHARVDVDAFVVLS